MADESSNKEFSTEDLRNELEELESQYQKLKFDHAIRGLDNPLRLRDHRKDIARVKTELRSRELSELSTEELAERSKIRARRRRQKKQK